jgi:hypothetical protein
VERTGEIGPERVGPLPRQLAADGHRLFRRRQGRLAPAEIAQPIGEVAERIGEIGPERVGPLPGQLAVER